MWFFVSCYRQFIIRTVSIIAAHRPDSVNTTISTITRPHSQLSAFAIFLIEIKFIKTTLGAICQGDLCFEGSLSISAPERPGSDDEPRTWFSITSMKLRSVASSDVIVVSINDSVPLPVLVNSDDATQSNVVG